MSARLFVISGPSGVGKGTLISRVRERLPQLEVAISATTRPRRPGEEDGREYHFPSPEEFDRGVREGEFLEHVEFAGHRYGTLRSEVDRRLSQGSSVVLEIDVPGAREIKRQMPDAVLVFIAPPDMDDLEQRLIARGANSDDEIADRLRIANSEIQARDDFQHVIVNDDLDRAASQLTELIRTALSEETG
ncbi:MAG: guanylate kinase [Gaiellales bacterium]|jgi:guanylate kinase|nr:guanylate kinase [Gaiellales bacterium]MDX6550751.1 guanylate kinase [Gaiellales bacterium]